MVIVRPLDCTHVGDMDMDPVGSGQLSLQEKLKSTFVRNTI